jgi:putative flavoprotein involved in K+ transport
MRTTRDTVGSRDRRAGELQAIVIGAGATGLSCARALTRRGVRSVVLERGESVGTAWRGRYRSVRLNSGRAFSALPGRRYPRGTPVFPARDDVVRYLEDYRTHHQLDVRTRTDVARIDQEDGCWRVTTDADELHAPHVVVATGLMCRPVLPAALTDGRSDLPVVHSAHYVDAAPYRGRELLVVGAGSSGFEIAHDLVRGGAERVLLSVRTPPNMLPRAVAGMPGDPAVLLLLRLPPRVADAQVRLLRRITIGDLAPYGLPVPKEGPFVRLRRDGDNPAVVDPDAVEDVRAGRIEVVPAVAQLDADRVRLTDGSELSVDAVIAATGFRPGLEGLVGHLGVLHADGLPVAHDERAALPGLRFVNFGLVPGLLRTAGPRARRSAAAIAREIGPRSTVNSSATVHTTPGPSRSRQAR